MTSEGHKPTLLSIIICNDVIEDKRTGKISLIGTFNGILTQSFPTSHSHMVVHVSLTDGRGDGEGELRLISTSELGTEPETTPILVAKGPIHFPDPLNVVNLIFNLRNTPFKEAGNYCFEFSFNGHLMGTRRVTVQLIGGQQ